PTERGAAKGNATRIVSGPGIEQPLEIPFPDGWLQWDERFHGAITALPAAPSALGEHVVIWSEAWISDLPGRSLDRVPSDVDPFDGRYWPDAGVLAVENIGEVAWYQIDPERR